MSAPVETCCHMSVKGSGYFARKVRCGKPSKVTVDGKHYCGIHDPVKKAAKTAEREAAWTRRWVNSARLHALNSAAPDLLAVCKRIHDELTLGSEYHEQLAAAIAKAEGRA